MRFKYYLRGIGLGIIFSSLIFTVAVAVSDKKEELSNQEIMERASELGMVLKDSDLFDKSNETKSTQETEKSSENNSKKKKENKDSKKEAVNDKDNKTSETEKRTDAQNVAKKNQDDKHKNRTDRTSDAVTNNSEKKESDKNKVEHQTPGNKSESLDSKKGFVFIEVKAGMVCRDIAVALQEKGVVNDSEEFRIYMGKKGVAQKIRCGTFKIPKNASFDEIIRCIIN